MVLFFLCHWGRQMTQVLHTFITLISLFFVGKQENASRLTGKPQKICSNLLGMTQHVSLRPSDALLQDPALLLKSAHCGNLVSIWGHFPNETMKMETSNLSDNVSVLSVNLSDGSQVTNHTEHLVYLQQLKEKNIYNISKFETAFPWVT